jgi:hypothetical protein
VPLAAPLNADNTYFQFHHSNADMMSHVPMDTYETSAAVWAIVAYGASHVCGRCVYLCVCIYVCVSLSCLRVCGRRRCRVAG